MGSLIIGYSQVDEQTILERGEQIAYVPTHVRENETDWLEHADTEFGFVWLDEGDTVLCRYWGRAPRSETLRTRANSERCNKGALLKHDSREPALVQRWLEVIESEGDHLMPKF